MFSTFAALFGTCSIFINTQCCNSVFVVAAVVVVLVFEGFHLSTSKLSNLLCR